MKRLLAFLPYHFCLDLICHPDSSPVGREKRFQAVALFVDIAGFSPLSEALSQHGKAGSEELTALLNDYLSAMINIAHRYGGSIAKFGGDALTILFTSPDQPENSTRRALRCALDMQDQMSRYTHLTTRAGEFVLSMKAGLAGGMVYCTTVGDPALSLEYIVAGKVLERASQAEHLAGPGEVVIEKSLVAEAGPLVVSQSLNEDFARVQSWTQPVEAIPLPVVDPDPAILARFAPFLKAFHHPRIVQRFESEQADFINEYRKITIMFVGFESFDYETDRAVGLKLQNYLGKVIQIIHNYQGYLRQVEMGDKGSKYIVLFGAPVAHENDQERTLRCALELREAALQSGIRTRTGIDSGQVYCGQVGASERQEYTAIGDAVNMAARLMQAAPENQILVNQRLQTPLPHSFEWVRLEPLTVKGKVAPLTVYRLENLKHNQGLRLQEPLYTLPLVGRESEVALFKNRLEKARQGSGQLIGLRAEAGMGKSRLTAEIIREAIARGFVAFGGAGQSYGTNSSYLVWQNLWQGFFELDSASSLTEQLDQLERKLYSLDPELAQRLPLLAPVLNLPIPDNELTQDMSGKLRKTSLENLLVDYLRFYILRQNQPVLLVLEDCHWIDLLSQELVENLARNLADLPLVMVLVYRPYQLEQDNHEHGDWIEQLKKLPWMSEVTLAEFSLGEASTFIRLKLTELFGDQAIDEGLVEDIAVRAQGNPFYLEELVNLIFDRGLDLARCENLTGLTLPDSLKSLIVSRMDQLGEAEKTTLKVASVVGRLFRPNWLWEICPAVGEPGVVLGQLEYLSRLDITPQDKPEPDPQYLFKHVLTQEVAYESLTNSTRANLHEAAGAYIERAYPHELDRWLDLLAHHYGLSRNCNKQAEYFRRAGENAQATYANEIAIDYYRRLLPLLEEPQQVEILLKLAAVMELVGQWDEAVSLYRQAGAICQSHHDQARRAQCQVGLGWVLQKLGESSSALEQFEEARLLFERLEDRAGLSQALTGIAKVSTAQGDYPRAYELQEQSLEFQRAEDNLPGVAANLNELGEIAYSQGDFRLAYDLLWRSLTIMRELGNRPGIADVLNNLGNVSRGKGLLEEARELYEEGLAYRRELGDKRGVADTLNTLGILAYFRQEFEEASKLYQESLGLMQTVGYRQGVATIFNNLGNISRERQDFEAAQNFYRQSFLTFQEIGDKQGLAFALNNTGLMTGLMGDWTAGESLIRQSLTLRRSLGNKKWIAECLVGLSMAATAQGQYERVVRLSSAIESLIQSINIKLDPTYHQRYEASLDKARNTLDPALFDTEWTTGQEWEGDQAINYALNQPEQS